MGLEQELPMGRLTIRTLTLTPFGATGALADAPSPSPAYLVRDLNPAPVGDFGASGMTQIGPWVVFAKDSYATGATLWRTDGTAAGTSQVMAIGADIPSGKSGPPIVGGSL